MSLGQGPYITVEFENESGTKLDDQTNFQSGEHIRVTGTAKMWFLTYFPFTDAAVDVSVTGNGINLDEKTTVDLLGHWLVNFTLPTGVSAACQITVTIGGNQPYGIGPRLAKGTWTNTITIGYEIPNVGYKSDFYFTVNGIDPVSGTPYVAAGQTVNPVLWVMNESAQAYRFTLLVQNYNDGTPLLEQYNYVLQPGQWKSFPCSSFTMPNENSGLSYTVFIEGVLQGPTQNWIINLLVPQLNQYTSISPPTDDTGTQLSMQKFVPGATINFKATVTNLSTQEISIDVKGTINPGSQNTPITDISPSTFTLEASGTQQITGSFTMPSIINASTAYFDILSGIQMPDGTYKSDFDVETELLVSAPAGNPTISVTSTTTDSLSYSITGFIPNESLFVNIIDSSGNVTIADEPLTNGSGSYSGETSISGLTEGTYTLQAVAMNGTIGESATATFTVDIVIPADYKIVQQTDFDAKKTYSGYAQRCIATFSFLPINWPGVNWFIKETFDKKIEDAINSKGEKPLDMTLYESPDGFSYILVMEATLTTSAAFYGAVAQGALLPWEIIGALIVVGLIVLFFIIKQVTEFVIKAPAAALATGLLIVGGGLIVVVGIAMIKGTSVKEALTGNTS